MLSAGDGSSEETAVDRDLEDTEGDKGFEPPKEGGESIGLEMV